VNAARALQTVMQQRIQDADRRAMARTRTARVRIARLLLELAGEYGIQAANGAGMLTPRQTMITTNYSCLSYQTLIAVRSLFTFCEQVPLHCGS
jgi:CRP-like cAMP-binding protein